MILDYSITCQFYYMPSRQVVIIFIVILSSESANHLIPITDVYTFLSEGFLQVNGVVEGRYQVNTIATGYGQNI